VVNVKPLPTQVGNFSGAVGNYTMTCSMNKVDGSTDDVLSVKMTIVGNGDAKRLQVPKFAPVDGLEFYEPKVISETTNDQQSELVTTKELEYMIVPKKAGVYTLKPEFVYFSPKDGRIVTLSPNVFNLNISQGTNKAADGSAVTTKVLGDIRFIKQGGKLQKVGQYFYGSSSFVGLTALPLFLLMGVIGYKKLEEKKSKMDVSVLKSRDASKVAQKRLAIAESYLKTNQHRPFYNEVSRAMFGFVSDKFQIPMAEFSKSTVKEKLQSLGVQDAHINDFVGILQNCEMALFAGKEDVNGMEATYAKALKVITDIEL
jgi:hypothetical protein